MKAIIFVAAALLALILFSMTFGCADSQNAQSGGASNAAITQNPKDADTTMVAACKLKCEPKKLEKNFDKGPCLGAMLAADDWVCDIAHFPREAVDDLPENQCPDLASGKAHHFVELTPDCKFIQAK